MYRPPASALTIIQELPTRYLVIGTLVARNFTTHSQNITMILPVCMFRSTEQVKMYGKNQFMYGTGTKYRSLSRYVHTVFTYFCTW